MAADNQSPRKPFWGLGIIGFNVLLIVSYTLILALLGVEGLLLNMVAVPVHFLVCAIVAIVHRDWTWLFAGILAFIAGFSTCFYFGMQTGSNLDVGFR